jgi:PPOX class probable FMN-dependent enzyme
VPTYAFSDVVTSIDQLREIIGTPGDLAVRKQISTIDRHCHRFIERSPFVLVSSANATGTCDVSPRGDGPGFVHVLGDKTLLIPERPGNRRADTLTNIIENPRVGLLFLIPNVEETLRVNGFACLIRDPDLLAQMAFKSKVPVLAIAVEAEEVFFHCAKAFRRSHLWQPEHWPDRSELPTLGQILMDQTRLEDTTAEVLDCSIEEAYQTRLY